MTWSRTYRRSRPDHVEQDGITRPFSVGHRCGAASHRHQRQVSHSKARAMFQTRREAQNFPGSLALFKQRHKSRDSLNPSQDSRFCSSRSLTLISSSSSPLEILPAQHFYHNFPETLLFFGESQSYYLHIGIHLPHHISLDNQKIVFYWPRWLVQGRTCDSTQVRKRWPQTLPGIIGK